MPHPIHDIDPKHALSMLEKGEAVLVDVREIHEHDDAHIAGDCLLPLSQFSPEAVPFEEGKALIFYCKAGGRSYHAAEMMRAAGYSKPLYNMMGGVLAWAEEGLPLESAFLESDLEDTNRPL